MSLQDHLSIDFEREVSAALLRAAELARDDAIKTNTGIVMPAVFQNACSTGFLRPCGW